MTLDSWDEISTLFSEALELPSADREAFVERRASAPSIAREVDDLLRAHERDGLFDPIITRQDAEEPDRGLAPGTRVGAWEILGELGRGGMGEVYRVRRADGQYEQEAAFKILSPGLPGSEAARFQTERQLLADLPHPHIARLLDGGVVPDGRPYCVMELVDGVRIDEYCDARRLDIDSRLALFADVCGAVQAAHERKIVHRDLKPANILVTRDGEPKLLDFGIAKPLEASQDRAVVTRLGSRPLTPEYASPEQIDGREVTPASDVYQLGVLLYELLVGRRPAAARGAIGVGAGVPADPDPPSKAAIAGGEADEEAARRAACRASTPARLSRALRGEVDRIVLRSLASDPRVRYATAGELSAAVARVLRPGGRMRGAGRYVAAGSVLLTLVVVGALAWWPGAREAPEGRGVAPAVSGILWVDDNPENNAAVMLRLGELGIDVSTALTTAEGLSRYDPERHQLVVSDMGRYESADGGYAGEAGFLLLEGLKARNPGVRLAFCTSPRAVAEHRTDALAAGALAIYTNCEDILSLIGH